MPKQVLRLLTEAVEQGDGDPALSAALLRHRLVNDPSSVSDRAVLIQWLARQKTGKQRL